MSCDSTDSTAKKKSWSRPRIIEVGHVEEYTTAGKGNMGDQTGTDRWKPTLVDVQPAELPDGE